MTNPFIVPQAATRGLNDDPSRRAPQNDTSEQRRASMDATRPGQESVQVTGTPIRIQVAPVTPNYRRSLFRR